MNEEVGQTQFALLQYLGRHYVALKQRLSRQLGSTDFAADALHDTWLRLKEGSQELAPVRDLGAYITRMAVNIAIDLRRRRSRLLSGDKVEDLLLELSDPAPGPEHAAEVRSDLDALLALLAHMPVRRREVALLVHAEGLTQREAALRLGVSLRTVEYELRRVHERVRTRLAPQGEANEN